MRGQHKIVRQARNRIAGIGGLERHDVGTCANGIGQLAQYPATLEYMQRRPFGLSLFCCRHRTGDIAGGAGRHPAMDLTGSPG